MERIVLRKDGRGFSYVQPSVPGTLSRRHFFTLALATASTVLVSGANAESSIPPSHISPILWEAVRKETLRNHPGFDSWTAIDLRDAELALLSLIQQQAELGSLNKVILPKTYISSFGSGAVGELARDVARELARRGVPAYFFDRGYPVLIANWKHLPKGTKIRLPESVSVTEPGQAPVTTTIGAALNRAMSLDIVRGYSHGDVPQVIDEAVVAANPSLLPSGYKSDFSWILDARMAYTVGYAAGALASVFPGTVSFQEDVARAQLPSFTRDLFDTTKPQPNAKDAHAAAYIQSIIDGREGYQGTDPIVPYI